MTETTIRDPEREAVRKAIEAEQAATQKANQAALRAAEARSKANEAAQRVDSLARERQERWAQRVVASYAADDAAARKAQDAAWRAFQVAASTGSADPLPAYIEWIRAGTERNRLAGRLHMARGEGTGHGPPFGNISPYLDALKTAVESAASRLFGETETLVLEEYQAVREGARPDDDGLAHQEGCPGGRTETFASERIGKAVTRHDHLPSVRPHTPVTVTRCLWCGAERVDADTGEA